ncbi:hypothetical protein GQ42DRAFT_161221 [Ramicandelaber brevisporus]|nr:hypothetical protein GQ42DRAFT_161221 [Ramicandelaber brevisporus]
MVDPGRLPPRSIKETHIVTKLVAVPADEAIDITAAPTETVAKSQETSSTAAVATTTSDAKEATATTSSA